MAKPSPAPAATRPTLAVLGTATLTLGAADGSVQHVVLSQVQRRILARLALADSGPVDLGDLVDAVWGDVAPATAKASLHNQVSRIRSRIGADALLTDPDGGYRLALRTDTCAVLELLAAAQQCLTREDPSTATELADRALGMWRGRPYDELDGVDEVTVARHHLAEAHRSLEDLRLAAALTRSETAWAVPEAERLVALEPHDEHRWAMLMTALDAAGRRGDALGAYERARRILLVDLGLEPGPVLRATEASILSNRPAGPPATNGHPEGGGAFVGRDDVVDRLVDALHAGEDVLLVGEAGSGKSRLVEEVRRRLRRTGTTVACSTCAQHPDTAVSLLVDLAEAFGEDLDRDVPPTTAFVSAVQRRCSDGLPLVLVVDDVDDAGPTSASALAAVAELACTAVMVTATDPGLIPAALRSVLEHAKAQNIAPLEADHVRTIADAAFDKATPPETVAWLHEMSGGNPLLLEYLLADPTDLTAPSPPRAASASPSGLQDVVRRRIGSLDAVTRTTLEHAAICGKVFPIDLLDRLAPREGITAAIRAGLLVHVQHDVATPAREMRFRHGAVRRIVLDDLPPGKLMEGHLRVTTLLTELGAPAHTIAPHALAAVEADPLSAVELTRAAAGEARALGAHWDAAAWYARCAEAADTMGEPARRAQVDAIICMGDELRLAGAPDQEKALFAAAEAAFSLGDPHLIGDAAFAVLQLGSTTETGAPHADAIELAQRALEAIEDPDSRAKVAAAASLTYSMNGHPQRCRTLFLEAEAAARSPAARRQVLPFAYLGIGHPRDLALRERLCDELITLGRDAEDPVDLFEGLHLSVSIALQRADGDRLRRAAGEMQRLAPRVGDIGRQWAMLYVQAAIAHLDGDEAAVEERATAALTLFSPVSASRAFAAYGGQLLGLRITQGRVAELTDSLEELITDQPDVPAWHAPLALALVDKDPDRAKLHATTALECAPEDFTWLAAHVVGARAAAEVGDDTLRARYRQRLEPWSGLSCWQGTCTYGPVDTALALLARADGRDTDTETLTAAALSQSRSLQAPAFTAEIDRLFDRHATPAPLMSHQTST